MERMHLAIEGMSCGHCVRAVTHALEGLDGVAVDAVAIGSADVRFDPARTTGEAILAAVAEEGYAASAGASAAS